MEDYNEQIQKTDRHTLSSGKIDPSLISQVFPRTFQLCFQVMNQADATGNIWKEKTFQIEYEIIFNFVSVKFNDTSNPVS